MASQIDTRTASSSGAPVSRRAVVCTFAALLAFTEIACRVFAATGFLYRRFDLSGALTSLAEVDDRLRIVHSDPRAVVLLGDSVLGGTALWEHREPRAREAALASGLRRELARTGRASVSLGADGLLLPDLQALAQPIAEAHPGAVLLLVNFRMLASEFQSTERATSRDFLAPARPHGSTGSPEPVLSRLLFTEASRHVALFRTAQLVRVLWYFPTQRDAIQRLVDPLFSPDQSDDVREAALRLKIAPIYRETWRMDAIALRAARDLVRTLSVRGIRTVVALAPQNPAVVEAVGDPEAFRRNRALLRETLAPATLHDLADRYPDDLFLDHCHLTAEGNQLLAVELARILSEASS